MRKEKGKRNKTKKHPGDRGTAPVLWNLKIPAPTHHTMPACTRLEYTTRSDILKSFSTASLGFGGGKMEVVPTQEGGEWIPLSMMCGMSASRLEHMTMGGSI